VSLERRLINFQATDGQAALKEAKRRGRAAQFSNTDGNRVHFEFVGVQDLMHLGSECHPDEVWYDMVEMVARWSAGSN
jgi:hypothetical protein